MSEIQLDGVGTLSPGAKRGRRKIPPTETQLQAKKRLAELKIELGGWRAVERVYGIDHGLARRIAEKDTNAPPAVVAALGIRPDTAVVQRCATCGGVHVVGWCTKTDGEAVKRKRRPLRVWRVDGFEVRAKSPADAIKKLVAQDSIVRTSATVEDDQGRGVLYAVEQVTTVRCKRVKSKEST